MLKVAREHSSVHHRCDILGSKAIQSSQVGCFSSTIDPAIEKCLPEFASIAVAVDRSDWLRVARLYVSWFGVVACCLGRRKT
jgi:hypothetical protein